MGIEHEPAAAVIMGRLPTERDAGLQHHRIHSIMRRGGLRTADFEIDETAVDLALAFEESAWCGW